MLYTKCLLDTLSLIMAVDKAACHFSFKAVPGIFADLQAGVYSTTAPSLDLVDQIYQSDEISSSAPSKKPWQRLQSYVHYLNAQSPATTSYKVLYIVRHGFGYHNEFMAKVGNEAWKVREIRSHNAQFR